MARDSTADSTLIRRTFSPSRDLEYFSKKGLETLTGYTEDQWWPGAIAKELFDNGLDAAESRRDRRRDRVTPEINVTFTGDTLTVTDNGEGILADVVKRTLDFNTRTSDKAAYVSPTRGAQGNALKTILGMAYVLADRSPTTVTITAQGIEHRITVSKIKQKLHIEHVQIQQSVKTPGTRIHIAPDFSKLKPGYKKPTFLQTHKVRVLVYDYAFFNPHATFILNISGETTHYHATKPTWKKWMPRDNTSAHWYDAERFENLIESFIRDEGTSGPVTVNQFVREFRDLTHTQKAAELVKRARLPQYLHDLENEDGNLDRDAITRLLELMQDASHPVRPEELGVLGRPYFRNYLKVSDRSFKYAMETGYDYDDLPFVVECAFAQVPDRQYPYSLRRRIHIGLNWSVPLDNPVENDFTVGDEVVSGLSGLLEEYKITPRTDGVYFVMHLVCPRFRFTDAGKGSTKLDDPFADAVSTAVFKVVERWSNLKLKEFRRQKKDEQARERQRSGKSDETKKQTDAAAKVIPTAYALVSSNGKRPANPRQIMYKARPEMQKEIGHELDANFGQYFSQTLLPDFVAANPKLTEKWQIDYDDRGHLTEPHTGYQIGIGTKSVREYLEESQAPMDTSLDVPELNVLFPTKGPRNRYSALLYIEKEGFMSLLEDAQFAERYDMAIASSKGMGTTALRTLIEKLQTHNPDLKILVLHDFDKSGFSILGTLTRDNRRHKYERKPVVIDLGLRLKDTKKRRLESEAVVYKKAKRDPSINLRKNGAEPKETEFLVTGKNKKGEWEGRRVELNAFTSDQFVEYIEAKLAEHGIKKVIPDDATIEAAYRRAAANDRFKAVMTAALPDIEKAAAALTVPKDIRKKIEAKLKAKPERSWDDALLDLLPGSKPGTPRSTQRSTGPPTGNSTQKELAEKAGVSVYRIKKAMKAEKIAKRKSTSSPKRKGKTKH